MGGTASGWHCRWVALQVGGSAGGGLADGWNCRWVAALQVGGTAGRFRRKKDDSD